MDRDLELVPPEASLIDEVMASVSHPLTQLYSPDDAHVTREQLAQFVRNFPSGHEPGNPLMGRVAQYHFWMRIPDSWWGKPQSPSIRILGGIGLRMGSTPRIELYYGHVGYHVYPAAQGRRYAMRACRLLLPLARRHGFRELWITCNPENRASRRTCEGLGARLIDVVPVPEDEPLFARGETFKCRYLLDLKGS